MLYRVIKWMTMVTKASKEHAQGLDIPVAVIVNYTFGGLTSIAAVVMLYIIVEVTLGNLNFHGLRVIAIIMACLITVWVVALRIVEIWLETLSDKEE